MDVTDHRREMMFRKVLLPTDGSDTSIAAADRAVGLARVCGAPLHVVFVQEPYPFAGIGSASSAGLQEYQAMARQAATQAFERIGAVAAAAGVGVTSEVSEAAEPAQAIVDAASASGADVIVMGSHGRTGLARLLLGSVAHKVLSLSPVAVMVVR
jgi:nucleotide-binding universal stress UspA family protein